MTEQYEASPKFLELASIGANSLSRLHPLSIAIQNYLAVLDMNRERYDTALNNLRDLSDMIRAEQEVPLDTQLRVEGNLLCAETAVGLTAIAIAWLIQDTPGYSTDRDDEKAEKAVRTALPNTNAAQFAKIGLEKIRFGKQA
jgi:hypothetical protein